MPSLKSLAVLVSSLLVGSAPWRSLATHGNAARCVQSLGSSFCLDRRNGKRLILPGYRRQPAIVRSPLHPGKAT